MCRKCRVDFLGFLLLIVMILLALVMIFLKMLSFENITETEKKSIPTMQISLLNTDLEEIQENDKNIKYGGNEVKIFYDDVEMFYNDVEIKGHGNFSWNAEKKSYRIKFVEKVELLGMRREKKWLLIANSIDDTLMRNDLAYYMAGFLGNDFQRTGEFANLEIDGTKLGVYYLLPTMKIGKQAVDLRNELGVLVEVDNVYCEAEEGWWWAENGDCLTVKDVVAEDRREEAMVGFLESYNKMIEAISEQDFKAVTEIIDIKSFAEYFIISEFTSNPDAYLTSWYLYKDGEEDKIHAGVAWDFDAAFGNKSWGDHAEEFYSPGTRLARFDEMYERDENGKHNRERLKVDASFKMSFILYDLMGMSEFREMVGEVYEEELRDKEKEIVSHIYKRAEEISEVAKKDAEIWEKGDFNEGVLYLVDWVERRFDFFDENYAI